jgi:excinuclease ABC subunit C
MLTYFNKIREIYLILCEPNTGQEDVYRIPSDEMVLSLNKDKSTPPPFSEEPVLIGFVENTTYLAKLPLYLGAHNLLGMGYVNSAHPLVLSVPQHPVIVFVRSPVKYQGALFLSRYVRIYPAMVKVSEHLQAILDTLPTKTGCYLMKGKTGAVIYVGKAVNLRARVRSYFHSNQEHPRTRQLVKRIADIEWILVGSELEALILEMNLIKKHRPHYNVRMKDDKRYPYIKIHWGESFPKVTVTRYMVADGARYFGPYTSVWAVHQTLAVLRRIFPYLTCDRAITGNDTRACLYYDIKLCVGPCIGAVTEEEYRQMISDLESFLNGRTDNIVRRLRSAMQEASIELRFESAATIRDQLKAIETIIERQKVVFPNDYIDSDVVAMARSNREACMQVFFIRGGKLIGREYFLMEGAEDTPDADVLAEFIKQFYDQVPNVPGQVMLPQEIQEIKIIEKWLNTKRGGKKVKMVIPTRGKKRQLVKMAAENAAETLTSLQAQWEADKHRQEQALADIQKHLDLVGPPNRIECYDISNTQGTAITASMVVFEQGVPQKSHYRRFNIRSVAGPDDFASMEEALRRRFNRWLAAQEKAKEPGVKIDRSFSAIPDLLIVDGGKGQLNRAVKVLEQFELADKIPVVGLAKREEEIFTPGRSRSILLPRKSEGLYLVQRIRDEAHRFAITAHRKRRSKLGLASQLDAIPGIGPARRNALLQHFGSIDAIRKASEQELASAPKMNLNLAGTVKAYLD